MSGINCQLSVCIVQEQNIQISHSRIDSGLSINKPTASLSCCWEVNLAKCIVNTLRSIYIRQRRYMRMNKPTEYTVEQNAIFYV